MKKILIINANYYKDISLGLLRSAKNLLPKKIKIITINVPGVFEIPVTISKNLNKFDAFIALGCVIKGQTPHFDFISRSISDALINLSFKYNLPVSNGILNCLTKKQAMIRSSSIKNKGIESAKALVSVLNYSK